jgi:hypothetical protein
VDFTQVSRVEVRLVTTTAASDFAINEITREVSPGQNNIPEPASLMLVAILSAGALGIGRRQHR